MFARGIIVLLCVLVAVSDGVRDCSNLSDMCTTEYAPVCGSDGITYGNACELRLASKASETKIFIEKQGSCTDANNLLE